MAPQTQYSPVENPREDSDAPDWGRHSKGPSLSKVYSASDQTWRLFKDQAVRLALTITLVVLVMATLKVYEKEGTVGMDAKTAFNVIITVLSLALGLNFLEAFKDMAKVLRWRVLAKTSFTVREADLILGGESLMKLLRLMWESPKKPMTLFVCALWIALNLLAQASVAMIGLTYAMEGGTNSTGIIRRHGLVHAANLTCFFSDGICAAAPETAQLQAHAYGDLVRSQTRCDYTDESQIKDAPQNCSYFRSTRTGGEPEYAFRYADYNPSDVARAYPLLTDRIVKASTGRCLQYSINVNDSYAIDTPDGIKETMVWLYSNETFNGSISIPKPNGAFDSTTYIFNGISAPQDADLQACGPRCINVYAMRWEGKLTDRPKTLFQCPITVSEVSHTTNEMQVLPAENARLAAASIALSGRYTNPNGTHFEHWEQYQLYAWKSYWESNGMDAQTVGARMAEFAIGSVAGMANLNPTLLVRGTVPILGYTLSVEWKYVIALATCIAGVHTAFLALMLWIARPVIITDDSNLCTARLLSGLVGRLDGGGCLLDGREIAEAIQDKISGGTVVYGVKDGPEKAGGRVLVLGEDVGERKNLEGRIFPREAYA